VKDITLRKMIPVCTEEDYDNHRSIIVCYIWMIGLGRFDIAYVLSVMRRFNMLPREVHLKTKRILTYLKTFLKGISPLKIIKICKYLYPDAKEEAFIDLSKSKEPKVRLTVYVDTDHALDLV
jgi:hypothetical protein